MGSHTILLVAGPCILFFTKCIRLYDSSIILTLPPPYQCLRKIKWLRALGSSQERMQYNPPTHTDRHKSNFLSTSKEGFPLHLCQVRHPVLWRKSEQVLQSMSSFRLYNYLGFPGGSVCKESACNAGDLGSIPELGRSPGEGNGNPLQYSCLENPMDRGTWQATVANV